LLTFVLVGAGPTGVEMAGALAELAHATLSRDFRHINPHTAHILLVEAGPRVLSGFPERLAAFARRSLERMGVEVLLDTPIEAIEGDGVVASSLSDWSLADPAMERRVAFGQATLDGMKRLAAWQRRQRHRFDPEG